MTSCCEHGREVRFPQNAYHFMTTCYLLKNDFSLCNYETADVLRGKAVPSQISNSLR